MTNSESAMYSPSNKSRSNSSSLSASPLASPRSDTADTVIDFSNSPKTNVPYSGYDKKNQQVKDGEVNKEGFIQG